MAKSNNAMLMVALSWITLTTARQMTINEANPPCEAPLVWEGQTGKLKFFYRPEAFSSEAFFAILKRADNPGKDIIVCTTRLGIKCNASSPQYNVHSVTNHSLTVLIPRITEDFEDTYMLLTYTKGTLQPTDACRLVVKANKETCHNPAVLEGQVGKLTFFLRPDILAFEDFFATLRRANTPGRDILVCTRKSPINCHIASPHLYQSNGIVDDTLTLLIPNVSRTFEDTYVLKVYANGSSPPFDACSLHVKVAGDEDGSNDWIAAPIMCLLLLIIGIFLVFYRKKIMRCWRRASKAYKNKADNVVGAKGDLMLGAHTNAHTQSPRPNAEENPENSHEGKRTTRNEDRKPHVHEADNAHGAEGDPLLGAHTNPHTQSPRSNAEEKLENSHEGKRWFVATLGNQDVDKLFEFKKNGLGSFVITQKERDQYSFTLIVCCGDGKPRRFQISQTDDAFTVEGSSETFTTLCNLVAHFRKKEIGNSGVKLSKPYQAEPNEAWYFGRLTREEEGTLFSSKNNGTGSFAVYESVTERDKYALSVKFGDKPCRFTIALHDDGFKFNAGDGTYFKTLPELVEQYQINELTYNPRLHGTLGKPCEKLLTDKEIDMLSTKGPNSYFCKPCIGSSQHVLAVNVDGEVKRFAIIKTAAGHRLADVAMPFKDLSSLINHYKRNRITVHGTQYTLSEDCTREIV